MSAVVHQSRMPLSWTFSIKRSFNNRKQRFVRDSNSIVNKVMDIGSADISFNKRNRLVVCKIHHRSCGIWTDSWQGLQSCHGHWPSALIFPCYYLCGLPQEFGSAIIAESLPRFQHIAERCCCQFLSTGKLL